MNRSTLILALSALMVPAFALADETTVYKTKDAQGNTVYSQIETSGAQSQRVDGTDPSLPAETTEKPKTETEVACDRAQANLTLLDSGKTLQRDKDGDGTPEDLTPEEIASEKDLAQRQVTAYCTPAPEG